MERREIAGLLAYMGRLDPRTMRTDPGELGDQLDQWQELLGDVPLATEYGWDARNAIRAHVVSSPYPILPVDVARQWSKHSADRLARHTDPVPTADPDDVETWRAELLGTRHAVLAGQRPPNEQRAITSGSTIDPAVEARLRAIGSCIPRTSGRTSPRTDRPRPGASSWSPRDSPTSSPCRADGAARP